tara:strand:+ start:11501 stop:12091 length:591 start_codon:yes stop_codon:yes gene_type:complete
MNTVAFVSINNVDPYTYNHISLFTGIGGLELGLREVTRLNTICYVEREISAQIILARHIQEKSLPSGFIWSDIESFPTEEFYGQCDFLSGGFPCPPFSVAGKKIGERDERNLWPEVARFIRGIGYPTWVFLENVPGIAEYYFSTIRPELHSMGYQIEEGLFSAEVDSGAPQVRQRFFILAFFDHIGKGRQLAHPDR